MANLTIEMPDDLARGLEAMASAQHKSVQQLAVERLRGLVENSAEPRPGSASAVLRAMRGEPHVSGSDVEELEAAIAAGSVPIRTPDLFTD